MKQPIIIISVSRNTNKLLNSIFLFENKCDHRRHLFVNWMLPLELENAYNFLFRRFNFLNPPKIWSFTLKNDSRKLESFQKINQYWGENCISPRIWVSKSLSLAFSIECPRLSTLLSSIFFFFQIEKKFYKYFLKKNSNDTKGFKFFSH